jgi:hypothetical protein
MLEQVPAVPVPEYPRLHAHVKEPEASVQVARLSQLSVEAVKFRGGRNNGEPKVAGTELDSQQSAVRTVVIRNAARAGGSIPLLHSAAWKGVKPARHIAVLE